MSTEEQKETLTEKAKAQIDALKTKEGGVALKEKAKEGIEGAKRIWGTASVVQRVVVIVAIVLVAVFVMRSCGSNGKASIPTTADVAVEAKNAPKSEIAVDLAKADDKTGTQKSFVGFTFGAKADEFENIIAEQAYPDDKKSVKYYKTNSKLKSKFRLFDSAALRFSRKDKRLYKITIQTVSENLKEYKPTSILREAQYCAAMIERKYGERFQECTSELYSEKVEKDYDYSHGLIARIVGSDVYASGVKRTFSQTLVGNGDSQFAIAPYAYYHGFFNNTIEIRCTCGAIGEEDEAYLGITITAMDHSVIEEEGGRTKTIPLDADDDEGSL